MAIQKAIDPTTKQKGFWDSEKGQFYPLSMFQPAKMEDGRVGYWNAKTGFIPVDSPESNPQPKPVDYNPDSFMNRVQSDATSRMQSAITPPAGVAAQNQSQNPADIQNAAMRSGIHAIAQGAGLVNDFAVEAVKSVASTIIPDSIKEQINQFTKGFLNTKIGQMAIKAIESGADAANKMEKKYPGSIETIGDSFNLATVGMTIQAGKVISLESKNLAADITGQISKNLKIAYNPQIIGKLDTQLSNSIQKSISGIVNVKRQDLPEIERAVRHVVANRGKLSLNAIGEAPKSGTLPSSMIEFQQAIDQLDQIAWDSSQVLRDRAAANGVKVSTDKLVSVLQNQLDDKVIKVEFPSLIPSIEKKIAELKSIKEMTIDEAQTYLSTLNKVGERYKIYGGGLDVGPADVVKKQVAAMRDSVNDAVFSGASESQVALKRQMADLRTLKDYVDSATNTVSSTNASHGLAKKAGAALNIAVGAATRNPYRASIGVDRLMQASMDKAVKNMFKESDKLYNQSKILSEAFDPQSVIGKQFKSMIDAGKKRIDIIRTLKEMNIPEPGFTADEIMGRFKMLPAGEPPVPMLPDGATPPKALPAGTEPKPLGLPPAQGFELQGNPYTGTIEDRIQSFKDSLIGGRIAPNPNVRMPTPGTSPTSPSPPMQ